VIRDVVAVGTEFVAEVPHRAEHEREFVRVIGFPAGELAGLDHEDGCVGVGERSGSRETVPENEYSHRVESGPSGRPDTA